MDPKDHHGRPRTVLVFYTYPQEEEDDEDTPLPTSWQLTKLVAELFGRDIFEKGKCG